MQFGFLVLSETAKKKKDCIVEHAEYYCSQCGKKAERNEMIGTRRYAIEAPVVHYFICGKCRRIFFPKYLMREMMRAWWKRNNLKRTVMLSQIYKEGDQSIREIVTYFERIGYTRTRFQKK